MRDQPNLLIACEAGNMEAAPFEELLALFYDICDTLEALNYQATAREYRQQADRIIQKNYGVH